MEGANADIFEYFHNRKKEEKNKGSEADMNQITNFEDIIKEHKKNYKKFTEL